MVLIAASTNKEIITVKECFKKEYRQEALATSQQLNCPPGKHMANVPCVFKFATSLFFQAHRLLHSHAFKRRILGVVYFRRFILCSFFSRVGGIKMQRGSSV